MTSLFGDISNIISLSITPAFLLLGVLMQMRMLNNRLERIGDRRELLEQRLSGGAGLKPSLLHELDVLGRRSGVLHRAVGFSTACLILVCAVVITLFIDDAFRLTLDSLIEVLFVSSMLLLVASFSLFLHEIFLASHTMPARALHPARQPDAHH